MTIKPAQMRRSPSPRPDCRLVPPLPPEAPPPATSLILADTLPLNTLADCCCEKLSTHAMVPVAGAQLGSTSCFCQPATVVGLSFTPDTQPLELSRAPPHDFGGPLLQKLLTPPMGPQRAQLQRRPAALHAAPQAFRGRRLTMQQLLWMLLWLLKLLLWLEAASIHHGRRWVPRHLERKQTFAFDALGICRG